MYDWVVFMFHDIKCKVKSHKQHKEEKAIDL